VSGHVGQLSCMLLLGALLMGVPGPTAARNRCAPCAFGGLCRTDTGLEQCVPSEARCIPRRGILAFNSDSPPTYVYWTLFAGRRPGARGRLRGRLAAHVDADVPSPDVPGFPSRCEGETCFGREGRFTGSVVDDRLTATVQYEDGGTCEFDLALEFGFGAPASPNRFACRDAAGAVLAEGPLRLQLIRLFGCRP